MKVTTKVPVLCRMQGSGLIEPHECAYTGPVMEAVWKNMNRQLLKLDAGAYFYPCDAMDAYHEAVRNVEKQAGRIVRGDICLAHATPLTYLTTVAYNTFYHFHLREVQQLRDRYRRIEAKTCGHGAVGEDGFDAENDDGTLRAPGAALRQMFETPTGGERPDASAMTAQQLAEALPGMPWARERRAWAAAALEEIYAALGRDPLARRIVRAFRAYVKADGNMVLAAQLADLSKTVFYRRWPTWLARAEKVGKSCVPHGTN